MNQKELSKTFMIISNLKNPLVYMAYTKLFQRFQGHVDLSMAYITMTYTHDPFLEYIAVTHWTHDVVATLNQPH